MKEIVNYQSIMTYQPSLVIFNAITRIERFSGQWEVSHPLPSVKIKELQRTTIITSTGASTRIEGALLSDAEVAKLIDKNCKITKITSRSEREVMGYINVMDYIYSHFQTLEVSEHTLKTLHQLMTSDFTNDMLPLNQRGTYKNIPNDVIETNDMTGEQRVWFKTTPPGPQTEVFMSDLIKTYHQLLSDGVSPLILIAWFVVEFLAIHPFRDGNGRLSRLITVWLLLKHGYSWVEYVSHEKFIEDSKEHYYVALRSTQKTLSSKKPDFDKWFEFFMTILTRQISFLETTLHAEASFSETMNLNTNERQVYNLLLQHKELSISAIQQEIDMSPDGLKKLLKRLVDKTIIQRVYQGRATKYRIHKKG